VGCRGGGGGVDLGVGRTARTAATFCVVLTLDAEVFFAVAFLLAALLATFGAGFRLLLERLPDAAFLLSRALGELFRAADLETVPRDTVALFAFGFDADLALTARFAVFEDARFTAVRADDRRKPFERLLLILGLISKGCSVEPEQPEERAQLSIASRLNQLSQLFAGALTLGPKPHSMQKMVNKEKHLMVNVGYVTVRLA
jgi:hypothetical protein